MSVWMKELCSDFTNCEKYGTKEVHKNWSSKIDFSATSVHQRDKSCTGKVYLFGMGSIQHRFSLPLGASNVNVIYVT
jgi:hypothetical protein